MLRRTLLSAAAAAAFTTLSYAPAMAQEVTLRLHQFLPPVATLPKHVLKPWAEKIEKASGGRIKIEHFDSMALGGRPPALMDQAKDGVADITMTVVGYTPGRYPSTEVFELPFMMTDPVGTSLAFWEMIETEWQETEYKDVQLLGGWVHGPGVIHTKDGVKKLEDMKGKTVRGPTRVTNALLKELGATPVGMPLPSIPEALSKGVINGTVIPWEVTPAIRLAELVKNHTEFDSKEALYTSTIVLVMNKDKYNSLPADLKAILDAESGAKLSGFAAKVMHDADVPTRAIATKAGNHIDVLPPSEVARWKEAAKPVIANWIVEMKEKGINGQALINKASALIAAKATK